MLIYGWKKIKRPVKTNKTYFISQSLEATLNWGIELGKTLPIGTVLALKGDLGAGKTTLMKGIAEGALSIDSRAITSPTFTYLNIYEDRVKTIYHFDLYRLSKAADFQALGFQDYFSAGGICCIEWPERITELLPSHTLHISLAYVSENQRSIVF
jgi:tRNA threonylcarbamoyladenosine biosynthesis protein TsaE